MTQGFKVTFRTTVGQAPIQFGTVEPLPVGHAATMTLEVEGGVCLLCDGYIDACVPDGIEESATVTL